MSVNALGSAHGSSGPNTIDPKTKKPYGPTFPEITLRDMVASQKLLVDSLGVKSLVAVIGPSMGGFQSFQWAASFPGFMKGIAASVTAPRAPGRLGGLEALQKRLAGDPNWNGGWYYENGGIPGALEQIRYETLLNYGQGEAEAKVAAKSWAKIYDGHSLVTLRRAIDGFDITKQYDRLKQTKVLYVHLQDRQTVRSRRLRRLRARHAQGRSRPHLCRDALGQGHMASHADAAMWAPMLGAFMKSL